MAERPKLPEAVTLALKLGFPPTTLALRPGQAAGHRLAKAVIVKDSEHYMMVVLPADQHVHLGRLHQQLGHEVGLASEQELHSLFPDCEQGAIPPLGTAYQVDTLVDYSMKGDEDVFFESGDHEHLIKMSGKDFRALMGDVQRFHVSHHL